VLTCVNRLRELALKPELESSPEFPSSAACGVRQYYRAQEDFRRPVGAAPSFRGGFAWMLAGNVTYAD
jgi:hypothetical protein